MKRSLIAAALLTGSAASMPPDLPWNVYRCRDDKAVALKFLSDGMTIGVLEPGGQPLNLSPVDEDAQGGFQPGRYAGGNDVILTLAADGQVALVGNALSGGGYEHCQSAPESEGLWQAYRCAAGKMLAVYPHPPSFYRARVAEGDAVLVSRAPQPGSDMFKGVYANPEQTLSLTIGEDGKTGLTGSLVEAPYENCSNALKP